MVNILSVKKLNKYYGGNHVLKDISMHVNTNQIISILGRNGAGKTTLIESIFNLKIKSSGDITFFDFSTNVLNNAVKEKIGVQLQISELFPNQTVYETIETFNIIKGNNTNVFKLISQFSLDNILSKRVKALSVGQKQRLMVCIAFIGSPNLIILDEPTSGIDPQIKRKIWENIINFKNSSNSVLFTTHDMNEAYTYSDKIIILKEGTIVENDTPKNLLLKYQKNDLEEVFIKVTGENLREND
ncbi:ABC transporter ATP-binding protein [Staphylococcus pseudintermedius]|uniref:ABC transporter ATP-binding protein n=7 Tax=Staphylococcus pseudintermedius TaxID=283734 RepID=UPI000BBCAE65|nr:ABC transporter ATP-binding protein [Staphylococcus pseudintermedius]EGQ3220694.1 ABC transporter ATP-binding protein [Staphylococcus pseudintermedius]EGQ3405323.1 ABC transporter ATP-binding protein [Staphylococcus pseudintermedius]EGQ3548464.1 ABC transporter ATP-binding protein [Staphylococcus pseudintermedius]EGQ3575579.1 ABC transporter ATP-binding protein [Staphylococcus pseudintermedius]EGQ3753095.1 ABC transporter ATP-binding protein [Staphylococcus pseudintermedius]